MRSMKGNRGLWAVGVAAAGIFALARAGLAQPLPNNPAAVSTEQPGSIVIYPKVVWNGTQDTIIELTNTSNMMTHARCFYVNAGTPGQWNETDFDIWLTKEQPTHWVVSQGRKSGFVSTATFDSDGAGLSPGLIPPMPEGFAGELECVEVDSSGAPYRGNALAGIATLQSSNGSVAGYDAVAFQGNTDLGLPAPADGVDDLILNLTPSTTNIANNDGGANDTGYYSACPDTLLFNFIADGVNDPVVQNLGNCDDKVCVTSTGSVASPTTTCSTNSDCSGITGATCQTSPTCPVNTTLTLAPCQADFETQTPGQVTVQFQIFDEFERAYSASTTVSCWLDTDIGTINNVFNFSVLGTFSGHARITPNPGVGGVIGIALEKRRPDLAAPVTRFATAAYNLEVEGNRFDAATDGKGNPVTGATDHIIIPAE